MREKKKRKRGQREIWLCFVNECQLLWNISYSPYGICSNMHLLGIQRDLKKICGLVIQYCH